MPCGTQLAVRSIFGSSGNVGDGKVLGSVQLLKHPAPLWITVILGRRGEGGGGGR